MNIKIHSLCTFVYLLATVLKLPPREINIMHMLVYVCIYMCMFIKAVRIQLNKCLLIRLSDHFLSYYFCMPWDFLVISYTVILKIDN